MQLVFEKYNISVLAIHDIHEEIKHIYNNFQYIIDIDCI